MADVEVRPLRRSDYDVLVDAGRLEGEPVELLGGRLIEVSPQRPRYAHVVSLAEERLKEIYGPSAIVRVQVPLAIDEVSEPEPDIAVVERRTWRTHPTTAQLLVEVADTSQALDLGEKASRYGAAGAEVYWVIDLTEEVVVVHTAPLPDGGFGSVERQASGHLAVPGGAGHLEVADLLRW